MDVRINRTYVTDKSVCGVLTLDGQDFCFTLEPAQPIPAGTYRAKILPSPKFSKIYGYEFLVPRLKGVPGYPDWDIEIHIGNYPSNTEGCTLVGKEHSADFLGKSAEAFTELMSRLPQEFDVTYTDPMPPQILTDTELSTV